MTAKILVTGGTGTLGRAVLPLLRDAGADVRVLSRTERPAKDGLEFVTGDLLGGTGIDAAVAGVGTILHLAGDAKGDDVATANLLRAATAAGVGHIVYISVTAAELLPMTYFRAKFAAEQAVAESGIPFTTLRAAQFHDFVPELVDSMLKSPVLPVLGGVRLQPVHVREVAARLAELTAGAPAGRVPDLVGPEVIGMRELVRDYVALLGKRRALLTVRVPGKAGRVYRAGGNLVTDGADVGKLTWADYLAERRGAVSAG
ncbi:MULTISPECIES: SDR family oxidoreductase [Nocardia]|uniref:NAD(P)H-binding protein n=1 Tax=Nocardia implantans TaxID=3108168 RepID=A0ABU6B4W2_9NOCA|nr:MULTISPECIES: NAD(P)H-binding protein [unclassified Nocardia]MBF6190726.1 NAD(P)H-binding protein [Nocardia beijingensis]MEA3528638.1 NAD(P)H-binding protein [Nocardia sp. CDC192]MEB3514750.1 NAD(P)H-binding protein [Nocardia sp. CDC186]